MKIAIAGGHGQIALLLARQLTDAGHQAIGIVRNPAHVADVEQTGATAVVADLEQLDDDDLALRLRGVDAVVFAAGAGLIFWRRTRRTWPDRMRSGRGGPRRRGRG